MGPYRIGIIGVGKIAQDQHLPVIAKNSDFRLAGLVSQRGIAHGAVPTFSTPAELFAAVPDLDAVSICTPPGPRHAIARAAIQAGKDVLLEKPPTTTTAELADLAAYAAERKRVLFTTWHSQYNKAVETLRERLVGQKIRELDIQWKEDVRRWHPGQEWIWQAGGFGVFDPGINALSILTRIMPAPAFVREATLVFPSNRDMPIAASLVFSSSAVADADKSSLTAEFDWRQTGDQTWEIDVTTETSRFALSHGGARLEIDGALAVDEPAAEYAGIYRRFAELLDRRESLVDTAPFALVADAFLVGRRLTTEPFSE